MTYRFERRGRKPSTIAIVLCIWIVLMIAWVALDMTLWIVLVLAFFTLPAVWDVVRDTRAVLEIWPNRMVWSSTLGKGDRNDIDHVRLNRRFDGSFKVTLVHVGRATTRLPADIAPPAGPLETALSDAGIPSQRHPFSLI